MKRPVMKSPIIVTLAAAIFLQLVFNNSLNAQSAASTRPYKIWVDKTQGNTVNGVLSLVGENHVQVLPSFYSENESSVELYHLNIPSEEISQIRLRSKGKVGRGILIGAAAGAVTGVIIGLASGDDPPCNYNPNGLFPLGVIAGALCESTHRTAGEKAAAAGLGLGLVGGVAGAIIGSIKIKIPINGSKENFKANRARLTGYSGGM